MHGLVFVFGQLATTPVLLPLNTPLTIQFLDILHELLANQLTNQLTYIQ